MTDTVIKILCVDDDQNALYIYEDILTKVGYCVFTADNVCKGLKLFEQQEFDVVITDMIMPVLSGLDMLSCVKKQRRETPVLLIAGLSEIKGFLKDGFDDVLSKPFERSNLLGKIERLLKRQLAP